MKGISNFFLFPFFLLLSVISIFAQPKISYIIPDIGTPGFGTYVEIVAPTDAFYNFGLDTIYYNNNGRVRIVFDRSEDSQKVVVGPLVITWFGRLLSTYFFVSPNLDVPNSSDWPLLDPKFRIPFRVEVNGVLSNPDTFYIVKPYSFGNLLQSNQVFGTGQLGRRSPSGALLVDNLSLSNLEYKVFLDNSITYPLKNRSYLPFIILSTNNIVGQGVNSRINVSAGEFRIQNAGPGGGGGGGRFCDNISGNPGEDGGNGFTPGGKGGVNYFLSGNGSYKNLGSGTGDSGKSLNGVLPPANPGGWEASGGGTGHPFGKSGIGSGDQSNWNYPGGYGGGTGSINNRMGGSGGFATDGQNEPSNYSNGGKTHGNPMIIPIAGGSGGASGNPSGLNVCSGSGGGGGGAIRIYAKRIENLSVLANGANGGQSSYGAGGGGSGGSISICSKEVAQNLNLSALGGNGGGRGYFRVDAPSFSNITYSHTNPSVYIGLSTDTTTFVKRRFNLTGSKNQSSDNVLIFVKSSNSDWNLIKTVTGFVNQNVWNSQLILPDTSKLFYLCAIQDIGFSIPDTFKYQPRYILSQSAMNILYRIPQGICAGNKKISLFVYDCPGKVYLDSGYIKNIGDGDLVVYFSRARFKENSGCELIFPKGDIVVKPSDSVKFYIRYISTGNIGSDLIYDSLLIEHSDDEWSQNPWGIQIRIELFQYKFAFIEKSKLSLIDTLNFGDLCAINSLDTVILLQNQSVFPLSFKYSFNPVNITLNSKNAYLGSNFNDTLDIIVNANKYGVFLDSILVYPEDCPQLQKKLYIKYRLINARTEFIYNSTSVDTIDLGEICVGDTFTATFFIHNIGNTPLSLKNVDKNGNGDFHLLFSQNTLLDIDNNFENKIICTPITEGKHTSTFVYHYNECEYKDSVVVAYKAVKSKATVIGGTYFGFVQIGEKDTTKVFVVNNGTGTSYFDKEPPSTNNFIFLESIPTIPTYLRPGDTIVFVYEFIPDKEGEFKELIKLISNSNNDCPDTIYFELHGFGTNAKIFANIDSVYIGLFPYCKSKDTVIYIYNKGSTNLIIRKVELRQTYNPEHFILSNSLSTNVIPPNSIDSCVVKFVGIKGSPTGLKTAELVIESNDVNNPIIRIKFSAFQENLNVDLVPDTLDFGICQVGDFKTRRLKLINKGTYFEPQRVRDFEGNKSVFEPSPSVAIVYPKDTVEIVFTFRPDREGEIFDSMRIVYFQPCPDTQWVYLRGRGTTGKFYVLDTLDFGEVVFCSSDTISTNIQNLGTIPFRVDSAKVLGKDSSNFFLITQFPFAVDSSRILKIVFYGAKDEREYLAFLRLYVYINNKTQEVNILLKAKPKRFIKFDFSELDFGFVPIGILKDEIVTLRNYGSQTIIKDYFFAKKTTVFSTDLQKNIVVPINLSPQFKVNLKPDKEGSIVDTLFVVVQYPDCLDTIRLVLKGFGVPPQDVIIRAGDVLMDPKTEIGNIPLYIKIEDTTKQISVRAFEFKISFFWNIFHPTSVSNGKIVSDKIQNFNRELTLRFDSLTISGNEKNFVNIIGIPLISDTDFSVVNLYDCVWEQPGYVRNTSLLPGSIKTIICNEGGKRLVRPQNSFLVNLYENESGITIFILSNYQDVYYLRLYDIMGNLLFFESFNYNFYISDRKEIHIPSSILPTGVILVQVYNSFERVVLKTIFIK
ncbi:MAG: hypothetical protein N2560_05690 [Ignavibacteria bacterium]|nr:hypothetical protein [Ignavibacteria bacterium]